MQMAGGPEMSVPRKTEQPAGYPASPIDDLGRQRVVPIVVDSPMNTVSLLAGPALSTELPFAARAMSSRHDDAAGRGVEPRRCEGSAMVANRYTIAVWACVREQLINGHHD
jgi:hypothetical protein